MLHGSSIYFYVTTYFWKKSINGGQVQRYIGCSARMFCQNLQQAIPIFCNHSITLTIVSFLNLSIRGDIYIQIC